MDFLSDVQDAAKRTYQSAPTAVSTFALLSGFLLVLYLKRQPLKAALLKYYATKIMGVPKYMFGEHPNPPPPDYGCDSAWACLPGKASMADLVPEGEHPIPNEDRLVDCFYVHPTSYYGYCWNEPLPYEPADEQTHFWHLAGQASAFNATCRIWAPWYRQATLCSFFIDRDNGCKALELAYGDILNAFREFLRRIGPNKPFVLAGHSQGSTHLIRLVQEEIDDCKSISQRLIAWYNIGMHLPLKLVNGLENIHESTSAVDTECVVGWDILSESASLALLGNPQHPGTWYKGRGFVRNATEEPTLQTNPMTWQPSQSGGRTYGRHHEYVGGLVYMTTVGPQVPAKRFLQDAPVGIKHVFGLRALQPMSTDCSDAPTDVRADRFWCESRPRFLAVPSLEQSRLGPLGALMKRGQYHCADFSLFYFNIRANVRARVDAYLKGR
eukprot:m.1639270 g.1639270  ORF g.1639270 m.1639270 type:complete len:440 (-) comp34201_c0_seq1:482-1801(-)